MGDVILTMKDIDKSFPGVHALDHVNFEVAYRKEFCSYPAYMFCNNRIVARTI